MGLRRARAGALAAALAGAVACAAPAPAPAVPEVRPQVLAELPHDTTAFTEGLQLDGDALYESTGLAGRSRIRELDPGTGAVRRSAPLPGRLWGEGIAVVDGRIWQLTYKDGVALLWDEASFTVRRRVAVTGEGWGLCYDGTRLIQTDGTAALHFRDPATFALIGGVTVTRDGAPLPQLNELECVHGQVWANVWPTTQIVRVDPTTGAVTAAVDASGLLTPVQQRGIDVLNGIAWLGDDQFLLTGKYWPVMLRVRLVVPTPDQARGPG